MDRVWGIGEFLARVLSTKGELCPESFSVPLKLCLILISLLLLFATSCSLFGSSRASLKIGNARNTKPKTLPVKNAAISLSELQRIKRSASTLTQQAQSCDNDINNNISKPRPRQTEAAKARKEYMKQLDLKEMEEQKRMGFQCDSAKLERIRKQAQEKIDEGEDIVKLLKTCSERATTFAIRDQQLKDKKEQDRKEQDYEQHMILAMEIDRLKEIRAREAEDARKVEKMIDDRKIIENQIEERSQARLLLDEARDQENREMLDRMKLYQEQDEEKARARREDAAKAREEIIRANEEDITAKRERKILEKREDAMMVAYQLEQDEKMRQREVEQEEAERRKRIMQKKLLDEQERDMDRRAEKDELRARRATEDKERKFRQKQLEEARKKKREMDVLDMARKQQHHEKQEKQQLEMEHKREEYDNAIRHSHAMAERERAEAEHAKRKNRELITNLQSQIEDNTTRNRTLEKEKYEEGSMIKQQLVSEKNSASHRHWKLALFVCSFSYRF